MLSELATRSQLDGSGIGSSHPMAACSLTGTQYRTRLRNSSRKDHVKSLLHLHTGIACPPTCYNPRNPHDLLGHSGADVQLFCRTQIRDCPPTLSAN